MAEEQKKVLIKKIYKEYEFYFQIVRKSIFTSVKEGILSLYSDLSVSDKDFNSIEFLNLINKNISLLIHSKLPLITIEQLHLGYISDTKKQKLNVNDLNELIEFKEYQKYQVVNFDYENELISNESPEFQCNNNSNIYEYYQSLSKDEFLSLNLDGRGYSNSLSKQKNIKKIDYEKDIVDTVIELIEESNVNESNVNELNVNELNDNVSKYDQKKDVFISSDNLDFFEIVDESFNYLLLELSDKINSELLKVNLIKENTSEDEFKCLSNKDYIIKHPYPFVMRYDLNLHTISVDNNIPSIIYLFKISSIELEFHNLKLSICRNNINELKSRFRLLNKKQRYWENKKLSSNSLK